MCIVLHPRKQSQHTRYLAHTPYPLSKNLTCHLPNCNNQLHIIDVSMFPFACGLWCWVLSRLLYCQFSCRLLCCCWCWCINNICQATYSYNKRGHQDRDTQSPSQPTPTPGDSIKFFAIVKSLQDDCVVDLVVLLLLVFGWIVIVQSWFQHRKAYLVGANHPMLHGQRHIAVISRPISCLHPIFGSNWSA